MIMRYSSRVKIGSILLSVSIILAFALFLRKTVTLHQTKDISFAEVETANKSGNLTLSSLSSEHTGKVKGRNPLVKFESDLENSLRIQKIPKIWLEYKYKNNQIIKVEIPEKVQQIIEKRWTGTLQYCYLKNLISDRNNWLNIEEKYINDAAVYATTIDEFEIVIVAEKRKISLDEAFAIVHLTAKLAIERYKELQNMASETNPQKFDEWSF